jgi:hypothetical protein
MYTYVNEIVACVVIQQNVLKFQPSREFIGVHLYFHEVHRLNLLASMTFKCHEPSIHFLLSEQVHFGLVLLNHLLLFAKKLFKTAYAY